eukprot:CAMPEP_0116888216 /NCGR_PEP_ID=MMETSP0463-20121206/23081_1 /TAXON_ID=181622 /ORGANISM="Strombidinopsis sp, Strain SopsisLIS2011" /LENGTH=87 /DNA_ID=CAMNT_0004552445 /DNA_START=22 /DNA_END=285 /DNA_ORIENTATION=+
MKDKTLAEFVLDLAKKSETVNDFQSKLEENGAEFEIELINSIYAYVTKMLPGLFKRKNDVSSFDDAKYVSAGIQDSFNILDENPDAN